ncbi:MULTISPECIES: DoxX family protein [unclassified Brevundimonas]|uniref:DoxX family protein n=1 Tax=unclassified Brevundimonas TaxID=2622653 RepID=UPI0025BB6378|nr:MULTISPECIES: DoxX family protein [unclassified Brevundimonas]
MLPRSWVVLPRRHGPTSTAARRSRLYMHLFLWVMQAWLAMFYIGAGYAKLTQKHDLLALMMTWPAQVDTELLRVIGGIEIALALFIVAPLISWSLFRTVMLIGVIGVLAVASGMIVFHTLNGDIFLASVNFALLLMSLIIVLGRWEWSERAPLPTSFEMQKRPEPKSS